MDAEETTEQRRARLRELAKQRAAALINGHNVLPHWASGRDRSAAQEGLLATRRLLETGNVELEIDEHVIHVYECAGLGQAPDRIFLELRQDPDRIFLVNVDGVPIGAHLLFYSGSSGPCFAILLSAEARIALDSKYKQIAGDYKEPNVYSLFYLALIGNGDRKMLSAYIDKLRTREAERQQKEAGWQREREEREREREERIVNEAVRFRDVLVRKYRQFVFTDEYETRDDSKFVEELRRFSSSRLPDVEVSAVVDLVGELVQKWAEEHADADESRGFSPNMTPLDYERYCSTLFELAGWRARLTKASGDQGADVVCEGGGIRLVVQCKLYSAPVGNGAVQEVIAAREYEYADVAVVVSNASFTRSARELANVANVLLLHHEQIPSLSPDALRASCERR